jgi:2-polyprenyl-3-methyl-5-hydroxy-6-metoxy-1,4-benzoquinol methylase
MKETQNLIQKYFAKRVKCYEEAYSRTKPTGLTNTIYHLCWFPLRLIFSHTTTYLKGLEPRTVLDIGCGCGNYSVELASRGALVTALDTCAEMIAATRHRVEQSRLGDRIKTVHADYIEWSMGSAQKYDLILAIGLFDYVRDAGQYLESFRRLSDEVIMTFPSDYPLSFLAHFSYRHQGVQGYFYTRKAIEGLLKSAGMEIVSFARNFPSTFWVHARRIRTDP